MKTSTLAFAAALALLAPSAVANGDDIRARFPDADTVIVNDVERVKYNPDGTYETTEEMWTKILTEKGRREASAVTLEYSKRYGEAAIEHVGAIGECGRRRLGKKALNLQAGQFRGPSCRRLLFLVEIGGNGDDGMRHRIIELYRCVLLQPLEDLGTYLLGRILLSIEHDGDGIRTT